MIEKIKRLFTQYREQLLYLLFGGLTTVVGWGVYYAVMLSGRTMLGIPAQELTGTRYFALYTVAQIIQWICAVLFAFFTNRAWVFTEADKSVSTSRQLCTFAGGRLITLGLDYVITLALTLGLGFLFPQWISASLLGKTVNLCEILSKVISAVVVILCNYFISKLLVFRKKKDR